MGGASILYASLEDHILFCLVNQGKFRPLIDFAVMMYVSRGLSIDYMLRRASTLGIREETVDFISYIHYVMSGGLSIEEVWEVGDIYLKVADRYFATHPGIERYVRPGVKEYKPLTPREVVMEGWKQIRVEGL
jgi:hypothetical protein